MSESPDLDQGARFSHSGRIPQLYPQVMVRLGKRWQIDRLVHFHQRQFTQMRQRCQRREIHAGEPSQPHKSQELQRAQWRQIGDRAIGEIEVI